MKNHILLSVCFVFLFQFAFCQKDTVFYYAGNNKSATKKNAIRYEKIKQKKPGVFNVYRYIKMNGGWDEYCPKETIIRTNDTTMIIKTVDSSDGKMLITRRYKRVEGGYHFQDYYRNGKLKQGGITTSIYPLHLEGEVMTFYNNGGVESIRNYKNNQMISNKNWTKSGDVYVDNLFFDADVMPQYPGGKRAFERDICKSVRYPIRAQENGITGSVLVHFIVDENGNISNVYIDPTCYADLNREAYKVICSLKKKWKPGILDGKKVKVAFAVPINFQLH